MIFAVLSCFALAISAAIPASARAYTSANIIRGKDSTWDVHAYYNGSRVWETKVIKITGKRAQRVTVRFLERGGYSRCTSSDYNVRYVERRCRSSKGIVQIRATVKLEGHGPHTFILASN